MARKKSTETFNCMVCEKQYKTRKGFDKHKCVPKKEKPVQYKCDLCENVYKTEGGLINHKCHIKLRLEEYKHVHGRIGFVAYQQFYKRVTSKSNNQKEKTLLDYVNSKFYKGFFNFGKFVVESNIPYYQEYLDFLITYNVPLNKWNSDSIYSTYIKSLLKKEIPDRAVEKSIKEMERWSKRTGYKWTQYFVAEDKYKIIHSIKMGRISPWVIYNCSTGKEFMTLLDTSDLNHVFDYIDPGFWNTKFNRKTKERHAIESVLNECGL